MSTFGRKPGSTDISWGIGYAGMTRGSIMGRPSSNGWVTDLGGRVGAYEGSTASIKYLLYATSGGTTITGKMAESAQFTVSVTMADHVSGANYQRKVMTPAQVYSGYTYALALSTYGTLDSAFGQDMSGLVMHDRNATAPNPYSATNTSPQGKMSLWAEFTPNRKPNTPSRLSPAANAVITDSTPTLGADFRDPDEVLTGFSLGQADKVKKYRFEVWNQQRTTRLQDSGVLTASSGQQTARRVTWTVPTALAATTYYARVTVWDMFDVASTTAEWAFTINAGGVFTDVDLAAAEYVAPGVTNDQQITTVQTWDHASSLGAVNITGRVKNSAGSVVRGPTTVTTATADGVTATVVWDSHWTALPRGATYTVEVQGEDTGGLTSPWAASPPFTVNAAPLTPTYREPSGIAVSAYPTLRALFGDANDASSTLDVAFAVRAQGDTGDGLTIPAPRVTYNASADRWDAVVNATEFPAYDTYEWRARATDPWGLVGSWSSWLTITYAAPPVVTVTAPSGTITTGAPTVTWTVDKGQANRRVTVTDNATGIIVHDSGTATTGTLSYTVPAGILRNETTYDLTVTVTSTDGLTGSGTGSFTVDYPPPPALASITVAAEAGPYEPAAAPDQWSRLAASWPEPSLANAPEADFRGYHLWWVNDATGETEIDEVIDARDATRFVNVMARSGVAYTVHIAYLVEKNDVDIVESEDVTAQASVTLTNTVLASLDNDGLGVPLRFWESRNPKPEREWEIVPGFGSAPVAFQGPLDHMRITGTFELLNDPHGTFTAQDIRRATEALGAPVVDGDTVRARVLSYRDPLGRVALMVLRDTDVTDHHLRERSTMTLELVEVNATVVEG